MKGRIEMKTNNNKTKYNYKSSPQKNVQAVSIPKFGFKSSFIIAIAALMSGVIIPFMVSLTGMDVKIITLISNSLLISLAVCYCQYFIESKKGFNSSIKVVYVALSITIAIISYFWLYIGLYI